MIIIQTILIIVGSYWLFYSANWLILVLLGRENKQSPKEINKDNPEVLLILPAYQPGPIFSQVMQSVKQAIQQRNVHVFVLLQDAATSFWEEARAYGFYVESASFKHLGGNTYQHALRHAAAVIHARQEKGKWNPEFVMILDKDNLLQTDFFDNIPSRIYDQYDIIQGKRKSLATKTSIAFFDSISEKLNDVMFRTAKQRLGCMIEISGSAALIETDLIIETLFKLDASAPGFDKNFMINLLNTKRDVRSIFWPASGVTEEKTSKLETHDQQRLRWFGEQYYNALWHGKSLLASAIRYKRWSPIDYLITLWRPPRSLHTLVMPLAAFVETLWFLIHGSWPLQWPLYTASGLLVLLAMIIFLAHQRMLTQALMHMTRLPQLAWHNMVTSMKSLRKENRGKFIHTTHEL